MSKPNNQKVRAVKVRQQRSATTTFTLGLTNDIRGLPGYVPLSQCPDVAAGLRWISDIISTMTVQLMETGKDGHIRLRDNMARFIDVCPYSLGTRTNWMSWIVMTLLGVGDGNAYLLPVVSPDGTMEELLPMPGAYPQATSDGENYTVHWKGVTFQPDEVVPITLDADEYYPWRGRSYRWSLQQLADCLTAAGDTKKAYMTSEYKPSFIVSAAAMAGDFETPEGRQKLVDEYMSGAGAGKPWIIPGDLMKVETVKPLSLNDIAIVDGLTLDKRALASLLGIPAFALGIGSFNADEYNNTIRTRIRKICACIEQSLTRGILVSPKRYFRLNPKSLYAYDMKEMASIFESFYVKGLAPGNEVRDAIGLSPLEGLNELVMLENYIPAGSIGDQKKLLQKKKEEAEQNA